ncbi:MAG: TIGR02594 family protein [Magnetococcales bacterium]|nr:TIGR02594 family protein [Magnetococcales bacterium]MBF0116429.1 TIGR02594 family protein [Magnetococcales bacterium]
MNILKIGSNGSDVRQLQQKLNEKPHSLPNLVVDGDFGAKTQQAVMAFQEDQRLTVDGIVGPATFKALDLLPTVIEAGGDSGGEKHPWMAIAAGELGVHENSTPGQNNARIVAYHQTTTLKATNDETPWCSSFVNWVLQMAGTSGTNSAAAKSWLTWGKADSQPMPGTIVVIQHVQPGQDQATGSSSGFHVAFYVSQDDTHIRLLGGNQSDQVKYSNFPLSHYTVRGMRLPA